jgi:hypothetical protein
MRVMSAALAEPGASQEPTLRSHTSWRANSAGNRCVQLHPCADSADSRAHPCSADSAGGSGVGAAGVVDSAPSADEATDGCAGPSNNASGTVDLVSLGPPQDRASSSPGKIIVRMNAS